MKQGLLVPSREPRIVLVPESFTFYPVTSAGFLEEDALRSFEAQLSQKEAELLEDMGHQEKALQSTMEGYGDEGDRSIAVIKDDAAAILASIKHELPKVSEALTKVRNDLKGPGRNHSRPPYGKCLEKDCSKFIERERLDATPIAPTCITHTNGCGCVGNERSRRN
ncbi:MAG: hypothetical protein V1885_01265 [Candidatus Brennerbacteria bacterium]